MAGTKGITIHINATNLEKNNLWISRILMGQLQIWGALDKLREAIQVQDALVAEFIEKNKANRKKYGTKETLGA